VREHGRAGSDQFGQAVADPLEGAPVSWLKRRVDLRVLQLAQDAAAGEELVPVVAPGIALREPAEPAVGVPRAA
jgi:hypothetical protein